MLIYLSEYLRSKFFDGEKGRRVEKQLKEIKKIFYQIIKVILISFMITIILVS